MSAMPKRESGIGDDPRISSTRVDVMEDGRLVGIWLNASHCAIVGLLEDRVDYQTHDNLQGEDEYLQSIISSIAGAEHVAIFGSDDTRLKLTEHLQQDKHFNKEIIEGGHCVALPKTQLITHVQKFFDQHKSTRSQFYNEQSRTILE